MTHLDIDQLQHLLTILTFQYGEQDLKNKHFFFCILQKIDDVDDHKSNYIVSSVEIVFFFF